MCSTAELKNDDEAKHRLVGLATQNIGCHLNDLQSGRLRGMHLR